MHWLQVLCSAQATDADKETAESQQNVGKLCCRHAVVAYHSCKKGSCWPSACLCHVQAGATVTTCLKDLLEKLNGPCEGCNSLLGALCHTCNLPLIRAPDNVAHALLSSSPPKQALKPSNCSTYSVDCIRPVYFYASSTNRTSISRGVSRSVLYLPLEFLGNLGHKSKTVIELHFPRCITTTGRQTSGYRNGLACTLIKLL